MHGGTPLRRSKYPGLHLQKPALSDEFGAHVDEQTDPEQTPLTQLASVAQVCPRLLRQVAAAATYVFPEGQEQVFVAGFHAPVPEHVHPVVSVPVDVEPPPHAVHGVEPEDGL